MNRTSVQTVGTALRVLTVSDGNHVELRRQILGILDRAVGFDFGAVSTVDPATLLWTS